MTITPPYYLWKKQLEKNERMLKISLGLNLVLFFALMGGLSLGYFWH